MQDTLERWGAFLLRPRATAADLSPKEGIFDGLWLGLAYVFGSQLISVGQAIKAMSVTMDANGALTLVGSMGRIALPPIIVSLLVEMLLGRDRAYRRGIYLLPLVLLVTLANLSRQLGYAPWSEFFPVFAGASWAVVWVFLTRAHVLPEAGTRVDTADDKGVEA